MIIKLDIENLHKPWINELDSNPGSFSSPMSKRFGAELSEFPIATAMLVHIAHQIKNGFLFPPNDAIESKHLRR